MLGLNRTELVQARVRHLRHLRALWWTLLSNSEESEAARSAMEVAVQSSGEYSSLSLDALTCWKYKYDERQHAVALEHANQLQVQLQSDPWIERYNSYLAIEPDYTIKEELPTFKDASIMYMIPDTEMSAINTYRYLVYVKADQELEDWYTETSFQGYLLGVPQEDLDNHLPVEIMKAGKREEITLDELFALAQPRHKFRNTLVKVTGVPYFSEPWNI